MSLHPQLAIITERIRQKSSATRQAYLATLNAMRNRPRPVQRCGAANLAHVTASMPSRDKRLFMSASKPHLGVVTAYNDMLSAHQPYASYPEQLSRLATKANATLQVAGGVPAMCDGITQGYEGMELSLFSRDVIAQATAVALSHDVFDAAILLGICDKIVPGLLIGALHFGHLPMVFIPSGPMPSGLSHKEKARLRERYAAGELGRDALLDAEERTYHSPGTCTFYGTANSNQLLLEAMGLILPNAAFVAPGSPERDQFTETAVNALVSRCSAPVSGIGEWVDERCIVNAMVALLATGGSTNHLIHWVAVARAAGIRIDWNDFADLSAITPLVARVYPNGEADVNDFHAAGGTPAVLGTLADAGLIHTEAGGLSRNGLLDGISTVARQSNHTQVIRSAKDPFSATGGLKLLTGNLGRSVIKTSAIADPELCLRAPARVFASQEAFHQAFTDNRFTSDTIVVLRFQGPRSNGMPELHKLMPSLTALQSRGLKVALLTDGRLSGASGKVPAAIHLYPEALDDGPLARLMDGDLIEFNIAQGQVNVLVPEQAWHARTPAPPPADSHGFGRDLFVKARRYVSNPEQGATLW